MVSDDNLILSPVTLKLMSDLVCRGVARCAKDLTVQFPNVPRNTSWSIFSLQMQRKMKRIHNALNQPDSVKSVYNRYVEAIKSSEAPGILLRISEDIGLAPALTARMILEYYIVLATGEENKSILKTTVAANMKNTSLIQDRDLALEVYLCILHDDCYGPIADAAKMTIGNEYEFLLKKKLLERNIPYLDEDKLRLKGFDKTPDIKLEIPIGVDGKVINWIESKAVFADEPLHQEYMKDQLWSYWNRFGPGLVIYWFGYVSSIQPPTNSKILIRHSFPDDCVPLTSDLILKS